MSGALGLPGDCRSPLTLRAAHSVMDRAREQPNVKPIRLATALVVLLGTASTSLADGFDLVIPARPGVPVIINGIDASYAVVEGDFGLGKGVHRQPTIY